MQIIPCNPLDLRWQQFSFKICFAPRIASFYVLFHVPWPRILIYFGTQWYRTGHQELGAGCWELGDGHRELGVSQASVRTMRRAKKRQENEGGSR